MTYKRLRKIQVYILIALTVFIFNQNLQIILMTRNILKPDKILTKKLVFLQKSKKTETKPNKSLDLIYFTSSEELFSVFSKDYIKDKHKQSVSRSASYIDKLFFEGKRLMIQLIGVFKKAMASVKYRYLLGKKTLEKQRAIFLKRLEESIGARGVPLASGILFGDLSSVSQETYHSFKVIGILHILSASSANFTIFLHFFLLICKPLLSYLSKKQTFLLYFAIIFLYFSLVGASASTFRAFLSMTLAFCAVFVLQRVVLPLFNLGIVAIFMLIINPFYPESLGFQLSFLASFGIIFMYNFFEKELCINKNILLSNLTLTFSAQFFLIPILIFKFGELNFLSILANLLVSPLVEILTILFLALFSSLFLSNFLPLTVFEQLLSFLTSKIVDILFILIDFLEKIPYKSFLFNKNKDLFTGLFVLLSFGVILAITLLKRKRYSKYKYRIIC